MPSYRRAVLAPLTLLASTTLDAQTPAPCDPNRTPFGVEASRSFCSLTVRPVPLEAKLPSTLPHWTGYMDVDVTVVVNSYGAVDRRWTQAWTYSYGSFGVPGYKMEDSMMVALKQFRFSPGLAGDTAVRAAARIHLFTRGAPDTLPAISSWRYVSGPREGAYDGDTLYLDWTPAAPFPVGTPAEIGTAIATALAELRTTSLYVRMAREDDMQLWTGCSVIGKTIPDAPAVEAWLRNAGVPLAGESNCASLLPRHAVTWTGVFRITPTAYMVRYIAPAYTDGKCRIERVTGGWKALCR